MLGEHLDRLQGVAGAGHGAAPGRRTAVAAGGWPHSPGVEGAWCVGARAVAMADGGEWRLGRCGAGTAGRLDFFSVIYYLSIVTYYLSINIVGEATRLWYGAGRRAEETLASIDAILVIVVSNSHSHSHSHSS